MAEHGRTTVGATYQEFEFRRRGRRIVVTGTEPMIEVRAHVKTQGSASNGTKVALLREDESIAYESAELPGFTDTVGAWRAWPMTGDIEPGIYWAVLCSTGIAGGGNTILVAMDTVAEDASLYKSWFIDAEATWPALGVFAGNGDEEAGHNQDYSIYLLTADAGMSGAANGVASSAAALSTGIRMGAQAASTASSSAALVTAIRLATNAISRATAAGTLNSGATLQASASDVVTAVAALTTSVRFGASAFAAAAAVGTLVNWATVTLAGDLYEGPGGALDPNFWLDSVPTLGTTIYYDPTHIEIAPNGEISSDSNDCAALVQFWDGTAWALGLLIITPHLVAYARDTASAAAQLSTGIELAAAAQALATVAAALGTGAGLSAQATDSATASGLLVTGIPLSALAANVSAAAAQLTNQIQLQAAALDRSTATANLNGVITLNAAATAITASLAALSSQIRLGAAASDSADADGSLSTSIRLDAAAEGVVHSAGALLAAIRFGGSANSAAGASADLTTRNPLIAAAVDAATAIATLSTGIDLRANARAISHASGTLVSSIDLLADAKVEARATAVLTDVIETPPVGVYASDPRFVIVKSRWSFFGKNHTPQFTPKDKVERVVLTFDLSGVLTVDETLEGPIELTIIATSGSDGDARAVFNGYPAYDMTKRKILLPVKGGVRGCFYYIKVAAATTNAQKYLALAGLLPIRG